MSLPNASERRGGRPASTSIRRLAEVAQALLVERGFEETTVEDIATAAGVNKRTFFRYFASKTDVLWVETPHETERFRLLMAATPPEVHWRDAIVAAAPAAIDYSPESQTWMRHRAQLVVTVPAVRESAALREDAWRAAATTFVAARLGTRPDAFVPVAAGHATLAALMGAHEYWVAHAEEDLTELHTRFLRYLLPV